MIGALYKIENSMLKLTKYRVCGGVSAQKKGHMVYMQLQKFHAHKTEKFGRSLHILGREIRVKHAMYGENRLYSGLEGCRDCVNGLELWRIEGDLPEGVKVLVLTDDESTDTVGPKKF